jgi:hypothetical protein
MADRKTVEIKLGMTTPPVIDFRTIPLRAVLRLGLLPPLPELHRVDADVGGIVDERMFGNDRHSCCVKSAMAHATLRFEKFEQGIQPEISDQWVLDEYFRETGGRDDGLVLTYAMKDWRSHGLVFGDKTYTIYSFAGVPPTDHIQVKYSIFLLRGIIFGMQIYSTDIDQFRSGQAWHLTGLNGTFEGGHGVYGFQYSDSESVRFVPTYNPASRAQGIGYAVLPTVSRVLEWTEKGITCVTWGCEQFMDWEFWDARVIQAFAVVDNRDKWVGDKSPVNVDLLDSYLREITGQPALPSGCSPLLPNLLHRLKSLGGAN